VTIAGVSQPTPLTVTVLPPPQPSYTLYVRGSSTSLTQGGSFQEYVLLVAHNGYAGVPVLSAWTPPGISVSFSNNALETYGVVTATISASGLAALGTNTIYITGNDGTAYYTATQTVTVNGTPLSVSGSVVYTNINATTHIGQTAKVTLNMTGGVPPFSYAVSNGMQMSSTTARPTPPGATITFLCHSMSR
jgi:hypothetical protein